jgi:hypothetical protein
VGSKAREMASAQIRGAPVLDPTSSSFSLGQREFVSHDDHKV